MFLSGDHLVPGDVRSDFFHWIEKEVEFEYWVTGDYHWQLRCVGGPGSGKVMNDRLRYFGRRYWTEASPRLLSRPFSLSAFETTSSIHLLPLCSFKVFRPWLENLYRISFASSMRSSHSFTMELQACYQRETYKAQTELRSTRLSQICSQKLDMDISLLTMSMHAATKRQLSLKHGCGSFREGVCGL